MLLHLDIIRGPHSTGVASILQNGSWELVKKKGNAWDLFDTRAYEKLMTGVTYGLIGHNRYATKGKVNNINAHPFEFDDLVGCHNGTIRGQHRLPNHQDYEVDSENIFHSIQTQGLEATLEVLDGAYVLVYWDKRTDDLVLVRNNERPLYFCFSEDGETMFWASEKWMLSVALSRNGIKYQEIKELPECVIHRFNFERKINAKDGITYYMNPFEEFVPPKKPQTSLHGGGSGTGNRQQYLPKQTTYKVDPTSVVGKNADFTVSGPDVNAYGQHYISANLLADPEIEIRIYFLKDSPNWNDTLAVKDDTVFTGKMLAWRAVEGFMTVQLDSVTVAEEDEEEIDYSDTFLGFGNKLITEKEFEHNTYKGCAWCTSPVTVMDAKHIHWIGEKEFVCPDCCEFDEVKEYLKEA